MQEPKRQVETSGTADGVWWTSGFWGWLLHGLGRNQRTKRRNKIGVLLFVYLPDCVLRSITHVIITSDTTVSQNRNRLVTAFMLLAAQVTPNLQTIEIPGTGAHRDGDGSHEFGCWSSSKKSKKFSALVNGLIIDSPLTRASMGCPNGQKKQVTSCTRICI